MPVTLWNHLTLSEQKIYDLKADTQNVTIVSLSAQSKQRPVADGRSTACRRREQYMTDCSNFQACAAATGKARSPRVVRRTGRWHEQCRRAGGAKSATSRRLSTR